MSAGRVSTKFPHKARLDGNAYFDKTRNMQAIHGHEPALEPVERAEAAAAFAALGSEARLSILRALVRAGEKGLTVGALQARLAMAGSTLSHHLRALMHAGVLQQTREGRMLICRARYGRIRQLAAFLVSECCADAGEMRENRIEETRA
jgi:DNA-binding transcriptional ArsR family regulator